MERKKNDLTKYCLFKLGLFYQGQRRSYNKQRQSINKIN